jgi:hypothetical protein
MVGGADRKPSPQATARQRRLLRRGCPSSRAGVWSKHEVEERPTPNMNLSRRVPMSERLSFRPANWTG